MGIWPHPDDEAYLSAGLMARMADAGRPVTVLTLTRGEKGTSNPDDYDRSHFAAQRERELRTSLAELGVTDVRLGDHRDGECDLVDSEAAIRHIATTIDEVRPDVLVTFGPDGITGHRDHRIVSSWVTEAWRRVGRGELLYATMTDRFVADNAALHERIGLFAERGAAGPACYRRQDVALECELSEAELDRKRRALGHHASQTEPWRRSWAKTPTGRGGAPSGSAAPRPWSSRAARSARRTSPRARAAGCWHDRRTPPALAADTRPRLNQATHHEEERER
jgi:LmbE family N-acetylglucosaminyl deacetylase